MRKRDQLQQIKIKPHTQKYIFLHSNAYIHVRNWSTAVTKLESHAALQFDSFFKYLPLEAGIFSSLKKKKTNYFNTL